jgi:transcriptional regulator
MTKLENRYYPHTHDEIAARLGVTKAAVIKAERKALKKIRDAISQDLEFWEFVSENYKSSIDRQ